VFCVLLCSSREAERKITTGLYVGEGSIFGSFSYTNRANKQSPFTLNLLRSLRNAVSYSWGSWRGVWNTFELGVSFSGGVYRDWVIVNSSSDAKVLVSSISTILQFLAGFFCAILGSTVFVHEVGFNNKFSRCGGFLCFFGFFFFFDRKGKETKLFGIENYMSRLS
jgi:hypothetical protein